MRRSLAVLGPVLGAGMGLVAGCYDTRVTDEDAFIPPRSDAAPSADAAVLDAYRAPVPRDVDLLIVMDDSSSMAEEHAAFVAQLPRTIRILASGDFDADGVSDVPPVRSMHVGVVTTDMGAGPHADVPSCTRGLGGDGILRRTSVTTTPPCFADYPSGVFEYLRDRGDSTDDFAATVSCVARVGTGGCGFEQPLEAGLKAVTPTGIPAWVRGDLGQVRFLSVDGVPDSEDGQGDRANSGFLRPDSILAIHVISDEEDCSVRDYGLFVASDPRFSGVPIGLRCNTFGDPSGGIVAPVDRYVNGLLRLRRDPRDLVLAVTAGIPIETEALAARGDYAGVLASPNMIPRPNEAGTGLVPSCSSADGAAFPPVRMVQVAAGLSSMGANVGMSSICSTRTFGVGLIEPLYAALGR